MIRKKELIIDDDDEKVEIIIKVSSKDRAYKEDFDKLFDKIVDKTALAMQDIYHFKQINIK